MTLAFVPVDPHASQARVVEHALNLVGATLGACEDDGPVHFAGGEKVDQEFTLERLLDHDDFLVDLFRRLGFGGHGDFSGLAHELLGQCTDGSRHGG